VVGWLENFLLRVQTKLAKILGVFCIFLNLPGRELREIGERGRK